MQTDELRSRLESAVHRARRSDTVLSPEEVLALIGELKQELRQNRKKLLRGCILALFTLPISCGTGWYGGRYALAFFHPENANVAIPLAAWLKVGLYILIGVVGIVFAIYRFQWAINTWSNAVFVGPGV